MNLFFKKLGEGQPLLILHGLFGSGDNWQSHAKSLSQYFSVYLIDQRNHGHSPHSLDFSYRLMSEDLLELMANENLRDVILFGHSMGGKTVLNFAQENSFLIEKLIVVDMGIRAYKPHHDRIFEGLFAVDVDHCASRKEAEERLALFVDEKATLHFLLKNLYWKEKGKLAWRFNLDALYEHSAEIIVGLDASKKIETPTLFIRGENSNYIVNDDIPEIKKTLPNSNWVTIKNAGHWPHSEAPELFMKAIQDFVL